MITSSRASNAMSLIVLRVDGTSPVRPPRPLGLRFLAIATFDLQVELNDCR
jgi:hypothetical protein